jgi:hypothetical protein
MELKSYERPWIPAFKGMFLIVFGIVAMLQIVGSIRTLATLFIVLINAMAILMIGSSILFKKSKSRKWYFMSGIMHLIFGIVLLTQIESSRINIIWVIFAWVLFSAIIELVEAGMLIVQKNAFFTVFILNALLTLLFAYFYYVVILNFTSQGLFYIGLIALVFGITYQLTSYLLSRSK